MGKFQKGQTGNPAGRPKGRTNPILDSIKKEFGGETGFWNQVAKAAKNGDQASINLLAARIHPPFKSRSMCVALDIQGDSARDYTSSVIAAVSVGQLPPDEAASLLNAILAGQKLEKLEELEHRINQIVERQNGNT